MGLLKQHLHVICLEQQKNPFIVGRTLVVSQQTVYATYSEATEIISEYTGPRSNFGSHRSQHKAKRKRNFYQKFDDDLSAKQLFELLGAESVETCDISDYEKPDIFIDLNEPVNPSFYSSFNTIVDAGTIEHVFDIPNALNNLAQMLQPGGTLCLIVPSSNSLDHGFYSISPTLFYDFFSCNGFSDMRCYLREVCWYNPELKTRLWEYKFVGDQFPITSGMTFETLFFARKVEASPAQMIKPVQTLYRRLDGWLGTSQEKVQYDGPNEIAQTLLLSDRLGVLPRMVGSLSRPMRGMLVSLRAKLNYMYVRMTQSEFTHYVFLNFGHLLPASIVSHYSRVRRSMNNLRYLGKY